MRETEIFYGNMLISEFMGWSISKSGKTLRPKGSQSNPYHISDIRYHTSWNWLMPVIDKIEDMGFRIAAQKQIVSISMLEEFLPKSLKIDAERRDTKLENSFDVVVLFIEWYNNYKAELKA